MESAPVTKICRGIQSRREANDRVYTPLEIAKKMIDMCDITPDMTVLDPCKGVGENGGVFYDNLPPCEKHYCEIDEGKDFFGWHEPVDLIIGNPPYSLWTKWIEHTATLTDRICYIFGSLNFTNTRILYLESKGYKMTKLHICAVDWWFGNSFIALFERQHEGKEVSVTVGNTVLCPTCNKRCGRGSIVDGVRLPYNRCAWNDRQAIRDKRKNKKKELENIKEPN